MDTNDGQPKTSLTTQLMNETYRFDFHQAFRILERLIPGLRQQVKQGTALHEMIQIKSHVFLSAPASTLYTLKVSPENHLDLTINFMGLAGLQGPLPIPYTETVLEGLKEKNTSAADFLNIFNHRLLTLYRRIGMQLGRGTDVIPEETDLGFALQALTGLAHESLQNQMKILDRALMGQSCLIWQQPHSLSTLETILRSHFGAPITCLPFYGQWKSIKKEEQMRLHLLNSNSDISSKPTYQLLGKNTFMGQRYWDDVAGIHLKVGPLDAKQYADFLPSGAAYEALKDLLHFYLPLHFDVQVELVFETREIPALALGGSQRSQLGWTTCLPASTTDVQKIFLPLLH